MTDHQIKTYEKCKNHIAKIDHYKSSIPYNIQMYGCGTGSPSIDFILENIHKDMYNEHISALDKAKQRIQDIIDKL